jgi:hypothetical protein
MSPIQRYRLHDGQVREVAGEFVLDALPPGEALVRSADFDEVVLALRELVAQVESGAFDHIAADHPDSKVFPARVMLARADAA